MEQRIVWGLDIGGTKTALCAADVHGKVLCRHQLATQEAKSWESLLEELMQWGSANAPAPAAIGVSCGSPMNSRTGYILSPPNLPGWDNVPVTDWLTGRMGVPAFLQNDANACALAEWQYGAGEGVPNMIFLTFGTGFGAGLILNSKIYEGTNGMAGEIGHVRMAADGPWGYGKNGSMEGFCSGGGLKQLAQTYTGTAWTAKELVERADAGDPDAIRALQCSAHKLGAGLSILIDLFNPDRIVIGSIFARAERWFRKEMEEVIAQEALEINRSTCKIVPAALGDSVGDIAAITVAWNGLWEMEKEPQA